MVMRYYITAVVLSLCVSSAAGSQEQVQLTYDASLLGVDACGRVLCWHDSLETCPPLDCEVAMSYAGADWRDNRSYHINLVVQIIRDMVRLENSAGERQERMRWGVHDSLVCLGYEALAYEILDMFPFDEIPRHLWQLIEQLEDLQDLQNHPQEDSTEGWLEEMQIEDLLAMLEEEIQFVVWADTATLVERARAVLGP